MTITFIDLGNTNTVTVTDMAEAKLVSDSASLAAYIGKVCGIRGSISHCNLSLDKTESNQAILQLRLTKQVNIHRIALAVTQWFSPERKGLNNIRLRYFNVNAQKHYINSINIVVLN